MTAWVLTFSIVIGSYYSGYMGATAKHMHRVVLPTEADCEAVKGWLTALPGWSLEDGYILVRSCAPVTRAETPTRGGPS